MNSHILILGRHAGMMRNVIAFLRGNGFANIKGVLTNEKAAAELTSFSYTVLVIGGGVDDETRKIMKQLIEEKKLQTKIIEHFGNPTALINEISNAISK